MPSHERHRLRPRTASRDGYAQRAIGLHAQDVAPRLSDADEFNTIAGRAGIRDGRARDPLRTLMWRDGKREIELHGQWE
jgi:hypothetical protein